MGMPQTWRLVVLAGFVGGFAGAASAHQDHVKVDQLPAPPAQFQRDARGKVEVVEYFWYGSTHANELEPSLAAWAAALPKDVVFRREHVLWGGRSDIETHARLFATLRTLKVDAAQQRAIFAAYHDRGEKLADDAAVSNWVAGRGIDRARFAAAYRSSNVDAQLKYARDSTSYFRIETVPTFVINGRQVIAAYGATGHPGGVLALVDDGIAKERARAKAAKSGTAPATKAR
jgi:thiol:disulfide interchange protein DsbA